MLHADAKPSAVSEYLQLVDQYGEDIEWYVVENRRGKKTAVAFGPNGKRLDNTLYLYLDGPRRVDAGSGGKLAVAAKELSESSFFEPKDIADACQRTLTSIVRRQGQPAFRQRLLVAYGRRCAISGCKVEVALEAAHIIPYAGPSTNHPGNGLLLRADLHTLFDLGFISVDAESMKIAVDPALRDSPYDEFNGRPLRLRENRRITPVDSTDLWLRCHRWKTFPSQ